LSVGRFLIRVLQTLGVYLRFFKVNLGNLAVSHKKCQGTHKMSQLCLKKMVPTDECPSMMISLSYITKKLSIKRKTENDEIGINQVLSQPSHQGRQAYNL
jgi:hypothetical protein